MTVRSKLRRLAPAAGHGDLWLSVVLFACCDAFFSGLALAYAFKLHGVPGVLVFIATQQVLSLCGHVVGFQVLRKLTSQQAMRLGVAVFSIALTVAGALPGGLGSLVALAVGGGVARGWSYACRLWQEMHLQPGEAKQSYFSAAEMANVGLKLAVPLFTATVLWAGVDVHRVFLIAGAFLFPVALLSVASEGAAAPVPGPLRPWRILKNADYWRTAPFYILDGAAHALRTALFVTGVLIVVKSVQGYSLAESAASLMALGLLGWQAKRRHAEPSLKLLRRWLALLGFAWISLILAMKLKWLVLPYVVFFGIGMPLASAQKAALTIRGMSKPQIDRESHSFARSMLLVGSRLACLAMCVGISAWSASPERTVAAMSLFALTLLPLEYHYAKKLAVA